MNRPNVVLSLIALAASAASASAQYSVLVVPTLEGGTGSLPGGVNDQGWVVGQADNALGELVAFVYKDGQSVELPRLAGGTQAFAHGVNNAGTIVGECMNAEGVTRPVVWTLAEGVWTVAAVAAAGSLFMIFNRSS